MLYCSCNHKKNKTMRNFIKFAVVNRFMIVLYIYCAMLCFCVVNNNPYLNSIIIGVASIFGGIGFIYVGESENKNAQERLYMQKLIRFV